MTTVGKYEIERMINNHSIPGWVRSERYEYCEDYYENHKTKKESVLKNKIASILTALFI